MSRIVAAFSKSSRLDSGLLLPPHLGQLLLSLAKIIGHGHADQQHPRTNLLAAGIAAQHLDDLLTHPGQVGAQLDQHLGGHSLALADQPEQDVLGADVVVTELLAPRAATAPGPSWPGE